MTENINLSEIEPASHQVRKTVDEDKLKQMAANIRATGIIQPIKVRRTKDGYEIVYGHQRYNAARMAGYDTIPAIIVNMSDKEALVEGFIENELRMEMTALDRARAIRSVMEETGWSTLELEKRGLVSHTTAGQLLSYLDDYESGIVPEPDTFKGMRDQGVGKSTQVRRAFEQNDVDDDDMRRSVLEKAAREGLTTSQTRKVATLVATAIKDGDEHRLRAVMETNAADPVFDQIVRAKTSVFGKKERDSKRQEKPDVVSKPVQDYIESVRTFGVAVLEATRSVHLFSPESVHRLSKWHYELKDSIDALETAIKRQGEGK